MWKFTPSCWNNSASQAAVVRLHFQRGLSSFSCRGSETPWGRDGRGQLAVWRRKWHAAGAVFSQGETRPANNSLLFKIKFNTAFPARVLVISYSTENISKPTYLKFVHSGSLGLVLGMSLNLYSIKRNFFFFVFFYWFFLFSHHRTLWIRVEIWSFIVKFVENKMLLKPTSHTHIYY